jgi:hypothetical protein
MNRVCRAALLSVALSSALLACGKSQQAAVAPAGKTQPPAVIPPPPKAPPSFVRDHYAKLEDCVYDWGYAQKCMPLPPGSEPSGAAFAGPIYAKSYREETQVQLRKEAIEGGYTQRVATDASDRSISKSEVKR